MSYSWSKGSKPSGSSSGGSKYSWSGSKSKPKGHRGFFGNVAHIVGQTGKDLEATAVGLGPGSYQLGKAVAHDTALLDARFGLKKGTSGVIGSNPHSELLPVARGYAHQLNQERQHPLRHPGNTILDLLTLAAPVGKALEIGNLAKAGRLADLGKPEARFVTAANGEKIPAGSYSRAASSKLVQKGLDKLRAKYPDVKFGLRNQHERVGFERHQNERVKAIIANQPAHVLLAKARGLKKPEKLAIRVVAEGVPIEQRIADARRFAADAEKGSRVAKLLHNHIVLLERAGNYIHDVEGVPRIRPEHKQLIDVYEQAKKVANEREQQLVDARVLHPDTAANRKDAPGILLQQMRREGTGFNPDLIPEAFHNESGFFVSYRNAKNPKKLGVPPQVGVTGQVGVPRLLPELTHEFTGESLRTGNINPDTTRVVAEDAMRANKFLTVWRQRDELGKLAVDSKETKHHIPIRPVWLKNKKWPAEIRAAIDNLDKPMEPEAEAGALATLHEYFFPKEGSLGAKAKGVKWIDSRYLSRHNAPATLGVGERPLRYADSVNQVQRAAILFKPGYVAPNLGNNIFLNILHGSHGKLIAAARLNGKLGREDTAFIDALMGEGVVASLGQSDALGRLATGSHLVQRKLGSLVDVVPRRAAFLHEAARFGYDSPEKLVKLLHDKSLEHDLIRVTREANGELIDYSRQGPVEQALIRRILFLYPWVKGATMYGGRFLREHPYKAGMVSQVGQSGTAYTQATLGDLPSYARGLVGIGGGNVVNTGPLNNFPQAAQELQTAIGLTQHKRESINQLSSQLTPLLQALLANDKTVQGELSTVPPVTLIQQLLHPSQSSKKVYPQSRLDAILRYLIGSEAPRKINLPAAHAQAARERSGR